MTMTRQTRYLLATVCLALAGAAGVVDGQVRNAHDAREVFYLTNPDGPAGNFAARRAGGFTSCDGQTAALGLCSGAEGLAIVDPWVESALRD